MTLTDAQRVAIIYDACHPHDSKGTLDMLQDLATFFSDNEHEWELFQNLIIGESDK